MSAPIFDNLSKYKHIDRYPFHMPGHKQGRGLCMDDVLKMDITEIHGFDNLHNPCGIIREAQKLCAKTFGSDNSFFIVNGSSAGIIASIMAVCNDGDHIITARNCHKSVYSGLIFSGAVPIYIMPDIVREYGLNGGISPESVLKAVKNNPQSKAVILTSPTYEGFTSDVEKIAKIVHENDMLLIIDEAHGAHMKFNDYFPKTSLECGADIVIQSVHKTLPSMTQTSVLHVKGDRVDISRLKMILTLVQSSSPSYILMASIDKCRDDIDNFGVEYFERYVERLKMFRNEASKLKNIILLGKELIGNSSISQVDLGKLVFYSEYISGAELEETLLNKYNIQVEMSGLRHIVAMTSVADDNIGFMRLIDALFEIDKTLISKLDTPIMSMSGFTPLKITPRKAAFSKSKSVSIHDCINKISAEFIIPYPPGIPIVVPGEVITEECYNIIEQYIINGLDIIGVKDLSFNTIEIID